jgi:hypothetical protein
MTNQLNEPPSDLFEDTFWEALGDIKGHVPDHLIKYAVDIAHAKCGGEPGDESYEYGRMLVKEHKTPNPS